LRIIGINGSPKQEKSQTRRLVLGVLEGARQEGADVTFVDICGLEIRYCTACGTCYAKGECIHDDDFPVLLEKMLDADGIVWGSPNYINSVTAQLKTMFDRMADSIHCQSFTGKYGCAVSTAGGSMAEEVADYMNATMLHLGATTVGKVAVLVGADPNAIVPAEKQAKELGRTLVDAIRSKWKDPVQEKQHAERKEYFKRLVMFNKDIWKHEYDYWKGWVSCNFFFKKIGFRRVGSHPIWISYPLSPSDFLNASICFHPRVSSSMLTFAICTGISRSPCIWWI
jgi:multimeric flavodoxin WrbA